jgi:hypothetical protein
MPIDIPGTGLFSLFKLNALRTESHHFHNKKTF